MLTSFKEIDHTIYFFHEHIKFIFEKIFYHNLSEFDEDKLVHPDFKSILNSSNTRLLMPLKEIVTLYYDLDFGAKIDLQNALSINNCISIFDNKAYLLVSYKELNSKISGKLKLFFENLWKDYPQVVEMEKRWGTVKDHYDKLIDESNCDFLVCPFCGLETFEPAEGKYKEAYDHIIAKASYPFASVNFKLLFPCCTKCNSNEKRDFELLYDEYGKRRKAFYPYDSTIELKTLEISISLNEQYNNHNFETLLRSLNWEFTFLRSGNIDERDVAWDLIYGIKRRFKERIIRLEKQWFDELKRMFKKNNKIFEDFKNEMLESLEYQIPIVGMGIVKFVYFKFIFSIPDIEIKLRLTIAGNDL